MLVKPVRHRQNLAELALVFGAETQHRCDQMAHHLTIEAVTCPTDAISADDRALRFSRARRLQLNQRKITGPAAEIGNQHEFFVIEPLLILVGRGDRLRRRVVLHQDLVFPRGRLLANAAQAVEGHRRVAVMRDDDRHPRPAARTRLGGRERERRQAEFDQRIADLKANRGARTTAKAPAPTVAAATARRATPVPLADEKLEGIAVGASLKNVLEKLGNPYSRIAGQSESLTYRLVSGGIARLFFDGGVLTAIERAEFATDFVLSRVNADEIQRQKAKAIVRDTINELFPLKLEHQASRQAFIDALSQPSVNRAALEQIRQSEMQRANTVSSRLVQAVADIADVLTPEQRTQLIELATRFHH